MVFDMPACSQARCRSGNQGLLKLVVPAAARTPAIVRFANVFQERGHFFRRHGAKDQQISTSAQAAGSPSITPLSNRCRC